MAPVYCPQCGELVVVERACPTCGFPIPGRQLGAESPESAHADITFPRPAPTADGTQITRRS